MNDRSDDPSHHERTLLTQIFVTLNSATSFGSKTAADSGITTGVNAAGGSLGDFFTSTAGVLVLVSENSGTGGTVFLSENKHIAECEGRKEVFYLTTHSTHLFTVIWRQTYGKGLLR